MKNLALLLSLMLRRWVSEIKSDVVVLALLYYAGKEDSEAIEALSTLLEGAEDEVCLFDQQEF